MVRAESEDEAFGLIGQPDTNLYPLPKEPPMFERQFLVARRAFGPDEAWRHIPLPSGWVLSVNAD